MDALSGRVRTLAKPALVHPDREYASSLDGYGSPDTIAWSPDDGEIAFERIEWFNFDNGERLPGTGLWELDMRTGGTAPLATHPKRYTLGLFYYHDPAWSPDGRRLAFIGEGINGQRVLYVRTFGVQRSDRVPAQFDSRSDSDWPVWAKRPADGPASFALAFRRGIRAARSVPPTETIRLLAPGDSLQNSNGELCRITAQRLKEALPALRNETVTPRICSPAWSPSGRSLALAVSPDPLDSTLSTLWVVGPGSPGGRMVAGGAGRGFIAPVWIGEELLGALSPRPGGYAVVTVRIATGEVKVLGEIPTADCDWSPDRSAVAFAGSAAGAGPASGAIGIFKTGLGSGAARLEPSAGISPAGQSAGR
jgi:hypothetical protein